MKKVYAKFIQKAILFFAILLTHYSHAAPGGTYTINASGNATSSNYKTFTAFFRDLLNGSRNDGGTSNGSGVGGAIILNVVSGSGPYTEQVTINQYTGISASNSITINGNGNILRFTATSAATSHTLLLDGADFITINNLTVQSLSSTIGRGIHLMNDARSNTISNCTIQMPNMTGTSTSNAYVCITNGTSAMQTYAGAGQDNTITGCTMNAVNNGGPYSAIAIMDANTGTTVRKNTISNNKISNFRNMGLWIFYAFQQIITGNEIFNSTTTNISGVTYGIYALCTNKGGDYIIDNNYIHDLNTSTSAQYGIYHYFNYGTGSGNVSVRRNRIVLGDVRTTTYGIYLYGLYSAITGNLLVDNNSIDLKQTTGSTSTFYGIFNYGAYYSAFKEVTNNGNFIKTNSPFRAYGILIYNLYNSQLTKRPSVSNNIIDNQHNMDNYGGLYYYGFSNKEKTDICFNTIYTSDLSTGTVTGTKYQMYLYYADGNVMNNNLVSAHRGGSAFGLFEYYSTATFSNNNIYNENRGTNYNFSARNNVPNNSLASYITSFSDNAALSIDPVFKTMNSYQPTSFYLVNKGTSVSGLTSDIHGNPRNSTHPDIGAIEYFVDVNLSKVNFKGINVCGGYKEKVELTMKNNGSDTLKMIPVSYKAGSNKDVIEFISKLNPNDSVNYTFSQIAEVNGSGKLLLNVELAASDDNTINNKKSHSLNVTASPSGFKLIETKNFEGYFRTGISGGSILNPDAIVPGLQATYEIDHKEAVKYDNTNYGKLWDISGVFYTQSGLPIIGPTINPPNGNNNATLTFSPNISYEDSLIYLGIKVSDLTTGCDSIFGRWIYIPHTPKTSFVAKDICQGNVASFTNKTTMEKGYIEYLWKFNDKGVSEDSTSIIDPIFDFSNFGAYDVVLTAWNSQFPKFTKKYTQTLQVTPIPNVNFSVVNACENVALKFINKTTLPIAGNLSYAWDFGDPSTTFDNSNLKDPTYTYKNAGGYKVTLRVTSNGCTGELVKNANQFVTPKAEFNLPSLVCDKTEIEFKNSSSTKLGNMGYSWNFGDGAVSNFENPIHEYVSAGNKVIKLKAISEFGCVDSIIKTVRVTESPKADFKWGPACNLSNTDFMFTGSKPASPTITTILWTFADKSTSNLENPSKLLNIRGLQNVTLSLTSNNGCSDVITQAVNVKLQSKANFTTNDECEGQDVVFKNSSKVSNGNLLYTWKFGNGKNSNSSSPRHNYEINGVTTTYNVTLVAIVPGGCSDSISKPVTVNALPNSDFDYKTSGRMVYFTPKNTSATNYFWRFGDGSTTNEITTSYHYNQFISGTYNACLVVKNASGCETETCKKIAITTGITEITRLEGTNIYPNPNQGKFTISIDSPKSDLSISIYDILGHEIEAIETSSLKSKYELDLNVADGIYLVKINNGGKSITQKITIN